MEFEKASKVKLPRPKVYMAGSMRTDEGWRQMGVTSRERTGCVTADGGLEEYRNEAIHTDDFIYVGPLGFSCDHGCAHGAAHLGFTCCERGDDRRFVQEACFDAIKRCDVFAAYIDRPDLHGTLIEAGFAKALGKHIWLGIDPNAVKFRRVESLGPDIRLSHHDHELWFLTELANFVWYGAKPEAPWMFKNYLEIGLWKAEW